MADMATRMKGYENCYSQTLMCRMPVVVRVDGKSFHSLRLEKPFDATFGVAMDAAVEAVAGQMQNFRLAYTQSDEASFLLLDTDAFQTESWFGNVLSKVVSISASLMTAAFNAQWEISNHGFPPIFDARAFNVPPEDVANYFLWRAKDCERNSVTMFAQAHFSHTQLHQKGRADMHEMLHGIGHNWATDVPPRFRNGMFLLRDGSRRDEVVPTWDTVNALVEAAMAPRPEELPASESVKEVQA